MQSQDSDCVRVDTADGRATGAGAVGSECAAASGDCNAASGGGDCNAACAVVGATGLMSSSCSSASLGAMYGDTAMGVAWDDACSAPACVYAVCDACSVNAECVSAACGGAG